MVMLSKQALLDRIQLKLALDENRAKEIYQRQEQDYQEQLALWLIPGGKRDRLVKLLRKKADAAERGEPVLQPEELNTSYRDSSSLWFRTIQPVYSHKPNPILLSLGELLLVVKEEQVSSSFLRDSGFRDFNRMFS